MLTCGAIRHHMPGISVAFEEDAHRVSANAETFGWDMRGLETKQQLFLGGVPRALLKLSLLAGRLPNPVIL